MSINKKTDFKTNEPHLTKIEHILNIWDRNKRFNIGNVGFLEWEEKSSGVEKVLEEIMAEMSPN